MFAHWKHLRLPHFHHQEGAIQNANSVHQASLSVLDKVAIAITGKVGSVGFFLLIAGWTVLWTGYNILASEVPALHWKAFDPFPAFVAYLLVSNVIQILLMPLIMVGQNLQGRHAETRAELHLYPVAQHDADAVPAHTSGRIAEGLVSVVECDPEHAVPERLQDLALELDGLFFLADRVLLRQR